MSPTGMDPAESGGRSHLLFLVLCLALAMVARWPMSVFWDALQPDPNTPLHTMVARDMLRGGTPLWLPGLEYPDGIPLRMIAWPLQAIAVPLNSILAPIEAMNLATLLWVTLQGFAIQLLGGRLGWTIPQRVLSVFAVTFAPMAVLAMGNGQFENVAYLALALGAWAAWRGGRIGFLAAFLAALLAVFSSPYQGVVCGIVLGAVALTISWRRVIGMLLAIVPAFGLAYAYFVGVSHGQLHLLNAPAPGAHPEPAPLMCMALPFSSCRSGEGGWWDHLWDALNHLGRLPDLIPISSQQEWLEPFVASYLGIPLMILGGLGLWRHRKESLVRGVAVAGLACLVLAFGSTLHITGQLNTGIAMPWTVSQWIPGLNNMQATGRLLSGTTFALVIGLGFVVRQWRLRTLVPMGLLLGLDGLLLAPNAWPLSPKAVEAEALAKHLVDNPVMIWPSAPAISPNEVIVLGLVLDRPVSLFTGPADQEEGGAGFKVSIPEVNHLGESAEQWQHRMKAAGVDRMVHFDLDDRLAYPLGGRETSRVGRFRVLEITAP